MAGRCADWNERTTKTFLDLCIDEKKKSNFNNKKGLTMQGWQNLYRHFRQQTGRSYSSKQLQNKFNTLKRLFRVWKNLKNRSGPGWDEKTGTITCSDEWWEVRIEEDSRAEQFCNRGLQFEDELTTLFGSLDSDNGTMMCVGAIGDRTPSGESEEDLNPLTGDAAGRSEDNVGHSSVSRLAQRLRKEHMVDSPPPKRTRSMEYYVERISKSMLERRRNETNAVRREQEEVKALLQILQEDGVSQGSELYFIATELFRSPARRAAFESFATAENRIA